MVTGGRKQEKEYENYGWMKGAHVWTDKNIHPAISISRERWISSCPSEFRHGERRVSEEEGTVLLLFRPDFRPHFPYC